MSAPTCATCARHSVGPGSGVSYCAAKTWHEDYEFADAMRLRGSPCGPRGSLWKAIGLPQEQRPDRDETQEGARA